MSTQSGGDAFVRFREVRKTYDGEHLVVKNLNLDIGRGEFLTLLGPSGSGKTTALMMLAGFETPTHGEILLDGKPLHNLPPYRRDIGMVFQNYALFPHMTVAENLAFPLSVRKLPKADIAQKVARALDMVRLGALAGRYPAQMSGGQQQRVALARALVIEPKLVLMDEPDSGIDVEALQHIFAALRTLKEGNTTVILITHSLAVLRQAEHAFLLCHGQIADKGSVRKISRYFEAKCVSCDTLDAMELQEGALAG